MSVSSTAAEDYAALMRGDITTSDITSNDRNAEILHALKDDDPNLTEIWMTGGNYTDDEYVFDVYDTRALRVLGSFVGQCATVKHLTISLPDELEVDAIEPFFTGLQNNRSIQSLHLMRSRIPRDFSRMLTPFIASNPNLVKLNVNCEMDVDQYRSLSSSLREGKSLKELSISGVSNGERYDHEQSIIENIEGLKMHPQLDMLCFSRFAMGRNACAALSDLFRQSPGIEVLSLRDNDIEDSGVEALVEGFAHCRALKHLYLSENPSVTARGFRAVANLLEDPNSRLALLSLWGIDIDDESATIIANALANNNSLQQLDLDSDATITSDGWAAFSKVLCDTTSVGHTFLSNHTLRNLEGTGIPGRAYHSGVIASSLTLNREVDKRKVALRKILWHHDDFDMRPLFGWDLKVLPYVVGWFERTAVYEIEWESRTRGIGSSQQSINLFEACRNCPLMASRGRATNPQKRAERRGRIPLRLRDNILVG